MASIPVQEKSACGLSILCGLASTYDLIFCSLLWVTDADGLDNAVLCFVYTMYIFCFARLWLCYIDLTWLLLALWDLTVYPRLASISLSYCLGLPNGVIIYMNSMFSLIVFHITLVSQHQAFPIGTSPTPDCYSSFSSVSHITHIPWSSTPRESLLSFHNLFLVNVILHSTQFCCPGAEASAAHCWILTAVCLSYMMITIAYTK